MTLLNWSRIASCGFITGAIFTLLNIVLVGALGSEFLAAVDAQAAVGGRSIKTGPVLYFATLAAGFWAMWLYALVSPAFSNSVGTIITISLMWWFIASLQSLKWILLLNIPLTACLPLAGNLIPTMISVFIGATLLNSVQSK